MPNGKSRGRQLRALDVGTEAWADVAQRSATRLLVRQSGFAGDKIVPQADPHSLTPSQSCPKWGLLGGCLTFQLGILNIALAGGRFC